MPRLPLFGIILSAYFVTLFLLNTLTLRRVSDAFSLSKHPGFVVNTEACTFYLRLSNNATQKSRELSGVLESHFDEAIFYDRIKILSFGI